MTFTGISWYVSPEGSPQGDGSEQRPWDIATAMSHPGEVEPGDVIWLAGGAYDVQAPLECLLSGTADAPIQVWGDPQGGPALLQFSDGRPHGLHIRGAHTWYGDFGIRCTGEARWSDIPGSEGDPRGIGILSEAGPGVKLIRLEVRDFGTSMFESQPHGLEIKGCIFSNSYWDGPDRSHGPGLYLRNPLGAPRKRIENNVIFQHGRQGLQGFGSTPFAEIDVVGNFFFNNGIADDGFHRNFMFGNGSDEHRNLFFEENSAYLAPGGRLGHEFNQAGGDGGSHGLVFRGNWLAHEGRPALQVNKSDGELIEGNRIVGEVEYTSFDETIHALGAEFEAKFPLNEYFREGGRPTDNWVRVRHDGSLPSAWRREGLAYIGILNWQLASTVEVDLSGAEEAGTLEPGTSLRIRPVQNRAQIIERVYTGGPVPIPMSGWEPEWPAGRDPGSRLPTTFPEFGVFTIEWQTSGEPANRGPARIPDPGKNMQGGDVQEARKKAWRVTDSSVRAQLLAQRKAAWRAQTLGRAL